MPEVFQKAISNTGAKTLLRKILCNLQGGTQHLWGCHWCQWW